MILLPIHASRRFGTRILSTIKRFLVGLARRAFPRPFEALDEIAVLRHRIEAIERKHEALESLGWDHVATVRRLAILEDRLEAVMRTFESMPEAGIVSIPLVEPKASGDTAPPPWADAG